MASPITTTVVVGGVSGLRGAGALEKSPSWARGGRGAAGGAQNGDCCGCCWKNPPNGLDEGCCGIARGGRGR